MSQFISMKEMNYPILIPQLMNLRSSQFRNPWERNKRVFYQKEARDSSIYLREPKWKPNDRNKRAKKNSHSTHLIT